MQRNQKVALVGGLLAVGVVAALPFSRQPETPATTTGFSQPGVLVHDIPLQLPAQTGISPATGLHDDLEVVRPAVIAPVIERNRLEAPGLPPELPNSYHSLMTSPLPEQSGARRLSDPPKTNSDMGVLNPRVRDSPATRPTDEPVARPRERRHRIVDGDTLARLAERYWGDAQLADALFNANRDVLSMPDPLPLGVVVKIPAAPQRERVEVSAEPTLELTAPVRQPSAVPPIENVEENLPLTPIPAGALRSTAP